MSMSLSRSGEAHGIDEISPAREEQQDPNFERGYRRIMYVTSTDLTAIELRWKFLSTKSIALVFHMTFLEIDAVSSFLHCGPSLPRHVILVCALDSHIAILRPIGYILSSPLHSPRVMPQGLIISSSRASCESSCTYVASHQSFRTVTLLTEMFLTRH